MSHSPAHAPVWNRDSRRNSAPCFSKIAFPCLAALTISSGLSLLKRANCTIAITSSSLGYRKLPHETLCSCGGITAPLKHGGNAATNRGPERPDDPTAWLQGKTTFARKAANGRKRQFNDPIPLPRGRRLVTLEDAGRYITKLPKAEHEAAEWQAAMEALILVATSGGPTMFARIGVMQALNRHRVREFNSDRKPHHWENTNSRGTNDSPDLRQHQQTGRRCRPSQGVRKRGRR